jgi:hypothetical protein
MGTFGSVVSGQWSVVSGQWSVVSGQWSVVSGQWSVVSEMLTSTVSLSSEIFDDPLATDSHAATPYESN